MYSVCYVITDNESLKVYQELILSVESLVMHGNPDKVIVFTEQKTVDSIGNILIPEMEKRNVEVRIVDVPEELNQIERSRYIKTRLRNLVDGDMLFIDTDTIIVRQLPPIVSDYSLAMVCDYNKESFAELSELAKSILISRSKDLGLELDTDQNYYNSGVIWAKDNKETRAFFDKWYECWLNHKKPGMLFDQYSLNFVNQKEYPLIQNLDGRFNVQINQGRGSSSFVQYLGDAVIIHYLHETNSAYILARKEFREKGVDNPEVRFILENPLKGFNSPKLMMFDLEKEELEHSFNFLALEKIYKNHRKLFDFNEKVLRKLQAIKSRNK